MKTNLSTTIVPRDPAELIRAYGDEIRAHIGGQTHGWPIYHVRQHNTVPDGIEKFFTIANAEFAKPDGLDMARVATIAAEHGLTLPDANVP